jgi:hypothetical protein
MGMVGVDLKAIWEMSDEQENHVCRAEMRRGIWTRLELDAKETGRSNPVGSEIPRIGAGGISR